jgi:hypothetical protein
VLLSIGGGGFATIPAYLRDLFGTHHVSAIRGGLLMAWSVAGVLGSVLVNYMRKYQLEHGADKASAYQSVLHLMTGLLVGICGKSTGSARSWLAFRWGVCNTLLNSMKLFQAQ